ncbi:MAG: thiamine phosphate synthase [Thermoleophilaceae bacterium]
MSGGRGIGHARRERLGAARLYLVMEGAPPGRDAEQVLRAALAGGVDIVQLRDKAADDDALLRSASLFRAVCAEHDALFWVNDRPDLVAAAGADGVHVGQHDAPVEEVRAAVGPDVLIGVSTHSEAQLEAALATDVDELSVGPVYETPTKAGRPATGLSLIEHAARHARGRAWFAIGGIDPGNVRQVVAAGAERLIVVRAIRDADDPRAGAAALRTALEEGGPLGAAP